MKVKVRVPGLPPSDNNAYRAGRNSLGRHLTDKAKTWKRDVQMEYLTQVRRAQRDELADSLYSATFIYRMHVTTLGGKIRKWDHSSHQKLTLDALADAMQSDDSRCLILCLTKHDIPKDEDPETLIVIETIPSLESA